MTSWRLVYDGFNPDEEGLREALCTLGNGYFATRGAAAESEADDIHYPGTYLAGGYNRLKTDIAGRTIENEDLVNLPNWLPLTFRIDGGTWFNLMGVEILSYGQELNIKRGVLERSIRFEDREGRRTRLNDRRLVHMENPHLAAHQMTLTAENWEGRLEILSALDGRVVNAGVERYKRLNNKHLQVLEANAPSEDTIYLKAQTVQSEVRIALAARTKVFKNGEPAGVGRSTVHDQEYVAQHLYLEMGRGDEARVEKVVSLFTSRDRGISECGLEAKKLIRRADSFSGLLKRHIQRWEQLWLLFDIEFQDQRSHDDRTDMILRAYIFHLLQTTSTHAMDLDVGVPSRGWHGEAYRGHIFWDELFIFPLLNLRLPEITRSLLMYRYRRLNEARLNAQRCGCWGAMFPWQSGSDGREESQQLHLNPKSGRWIPDNSNLQRHVNAAIAYNVYQYYQVTDDKEFLSFYGAEMLVEIARFWASLASYNEGLDRYEILGVMGPDEYHDGYPGAEEPGLNNNAYTNVMAAWVLDCALEVVSEILPEDRSSVIRERLGLTEEEMKVWREISRKMRVVFHGEGIISQFEGYDQLREFDWEGYRKKYGDIQRLDRILEAEGDTPNRYKASKQADVLMLFYLFSSEELARLFGRLGYPFEYDTIPKNVDYYLKRTSHGSTLSRVVHSWVLARSDRARSWKLFKGALESDISDIQGGTTPEGIHLGAMAGVADLLKRGYLGIEHRGDVLYFNPCLPEEVEKMKMQVRYRGHSLDLQVTSNRLTINACRSAAGPIKIGFKGKSFELNQGDTKELALQS